MVVHLSSIWALYIKPKSNSVISRSHSSLLVARKYGRDLKFERRIIDFWSKNGEGCRQIRVDWNGKRSRSRREGDDEKGKNYERNWLVGCGSRRRGQEDRGCASLNTLNWWCCRCWCESRCLPESWWSALERNEKPQRCHDNAAPVNSSPISPARNGKHVSKASVDNDWN